MFGRLRRLERENDVLREALGWYAVRDHWRRRAKNPTGAPRRWSKSPATIDRGARAMFALTQVNAVRTRDGLFTRLSQLFVRQPTAPIKPTVPAPLPPSPRGDEGNDSDYLDRMAGHWPPEQQSQGLPEPTEDSA